MKLRKRVKDETGQAIVEFALTLPLVLTLLCGMLDFGWIYANQYKVENAAYSAARYASLNAQTVSEDQLISTASERAISNLDSEEEAQVSVTVGESSVSVTVTLPVKTLTFVASSIFGDYYYSSSTSVASY